MNVHLAEQLIYTAEKSLKDTPSIPDDIKNAVNEKITALKSAIGGSASPEGGKESGTIDSIKPATEALSTELSKIGEYLSKNPPAASAQGSGAPKQDGEVKDAEVKEEPKDGDNK